MGRLQCEICGGQLRKVESNQFECVNCGALYSLEDARRMIEKAASEVSSSRQSTVQTHYKSSNVNYYEEVSLGLFKKTLLQITDSKLKWKDCEYPINQIWGINPYIVNHNIKIGHSKPTKVNTSYYVHLEINGEIVSLELNNESQYDKVLDIVWKLRYSAIINNILMNFRNGEVVKMGDCILKDDGIEYDVSTWHLFSPNEHKKFLLPWSECGVGWVYEIWEGNHYFPSYVYVKKLEERCSNVRLTDLPSEYMNSRFYLILLELAKKYKPNRLSQFLK